MSTKIPRGAVVSLLLAAFMSLSAGPASAKTEITVWHSWTGAGGEVIEGLIQKFNSSQDEIVVKILQTSDLRQKVLTAVAGGVAPDVVLFDRYTTGQLAARGALAPMDSYIEKAGIKAADFFAPAWQETVYNGHVYSIPIETNARVLMYNKRLFREAGLDPNKPPQTWDELVKYAMLLTKKDDKGNLVQVGFGPTWNNANLVHYLWQTGGDVLNEDMTKVTFNDSRGVAALQWLVDFVDRYGGVEKYNSFASGFGSEVTNPFYIGKVAMKTDGNWNYADMRRYAPDFLKKDLGLAPLPYKTTRATLAGGFSLIIPKPAKHKEEAWKFIQFMIRKENQIQFGLGTGSLPALKAAALDPQFSKDPFFKPFIDAMSYARYRPVHPAFPEIDELIMQATEEAIYKRKTPKEALDDAARRAQRLLDRYNKHFKRN